MKIRVGVENTQSVETKQTEKIGTVPTFIKERIETKTHILNVRQNSESNITTSLYDLSDNLIEIRKFKTDKTGFDLLKLYINLVKDGYEKNKAEIMKIEA